MRIPIAELFSCVLTMIVAAGCGFGGGPDPAGPSVLVGTQQEGVLQDANGETVYVHDTMQICLERCAQVWTPVKANRVPSEQVTLGVDLISYRNETYLAHNGKVLHTYSGDRSPGDQLGHGSGGVWSVVEIN